MFIQIEVSYLYNKLSFSGILLIHVCVHIHIKSPDFQGSSSSYDVRYQSGLQLLWESFGNMSHPSEGYCNKRGFPFVCVSEKD